jgi:hypothetical protein
MDVRVADCPNAVPVQGQPVILPIARGWNRLVAAEDTESLGHAGLRPQFAMKVMTLVQ